jgi:RNA polymerase sigma factor (sigma-70 family)
MNLITDNQGFIWHVVNKVAKNNHHLKDDLFQEACVWLLERENLFDSSKGNVVNYFYKGLYSYLMDKARKMVDDTYKNKSAKDVEKPVSLEQQHDCELPSVEFEFNDELADLISNLDEKDRRIMLMYRDGYSFEEIGGCEGVSRQRVKQIVDNAVKKIRRSVFINEWAEKLGDIYEYETLMFNPEIPVPEFEVEVQNPKIKTVATGEPNLDIMLMKAYERQPFVRKVEPEFGGMCDMKYIIVYVE